MLDYVTRDGKRLRRGYTTGTCAAGAAGAAALMLLTGRPVEAVRVDTPAGPRLTLEVEAIELGSDYARCAVRKDAGDDPDVTDGMLVYAAAKKTEAGIVIDGGEGVGRVTKPGLNQPVGAAAINATPRKMIAEQVRAACERCGYTGGMEIVISVPGGEALARRTFNPRLGIEGGLSILGTTGIVEPMSAAALADTVALELDVLRASGATGVLLCPGNYGERFARDALGLSMDGQVTTGNLIGDAVQAAAAKGFEAILLVGHIGKLVKLGIGMRNTHSRCGDGRMETLVACALSAGAQTGLLRQLLDCATTDAALDALDAAGLLRPTMDALGERISRTLERWADGRAQIGFICFTNAPARTGVLAQSANAGALAERWHI